MIDPPERRRPKGRFGGLWQFGGFRGVGTRDWAARVSLRGERGCASEPVAREGVPVEGWEGAEAVSRSRSYRTLVTLRGSLRGGAAELSGGSCWGPDPT